MEHVFAGALAGVILLAIGLTVYEWTRPPAHARAVDAPRYRCIECDHEFEAEAWGMPHEGMAEAIDPASVPLDCPECETAESSIRMTPCPKCDRYYVGQRNQYVFDYNEPAPPEVRDVCPHCDTDRTQYLREHRRR